MKKVLLSIFAILSLMGAQKVFAAGEPFVFISSSVIFSNLPSSATLKVADTYVTSIQLQNLSNSTSTVTYSVNGTTDVFRDSINIPVLPSVSKNYQITILSLTNGNTVQIRVAGGKNSLAQ